MHVPFGLFTKLELKKDLLVLGSLPVLQVQHCLGPSVREDVSDEGLNNFRTISVLCSVSAYEENMTSLWSL